MKSTIIKRFVFRFAIGLFTFFLGLGAFIGWADIKGSSYSGELDLRFASDTAVFRVDENPTIKLYITNNGKDTVTLVHPGDGSEVGWRTPLVEWTIRETGSWNEHSLTEDLQLYGRCGNIKSLDWADVFRLAPGETKEIEAWLPRFRAPGTYRVKFSYMNEPWKEWRGIARRMHNPIAMWRVKHSTECSLTSNEALFVVTE